MGLFSRRERNASDDDKARDEDASGGAISTDEIHQLIESAAADKSNKASFADELDTELDDEEFVEKPGIPKYVEETEPEVMPLTDAHSYALEKHAQGLESIQDDLSDLEDIIARFKERSSHMIPFGMQLRAEHARNLEIGRQRDEFKSEIGTLTELAQHQTDTISDLEAELESVGGQHEQSRMELHELEKRFAIEQESNQKLRDHEQQLTYDLKAMQVRVDDLESDESHVKADLERTRALKVEAEKALAESVREHTALRAAYSQLEIKLEKAIDLEKQLTTNKEQSINDRRQLRREISTLKAKMGEYELQIQRLQGEKENLSKRISSEKFSFAHDRDALANEINVLRNANSGSRAEVAALRSALEKSEAERDRVRSELDEMKRNVSRGREELSSQNRSISDLSLKYSADLLSLDQMRDENQDLRNRLEHIHSEYKRLADVEAQLRSSEERAGKLEAKLAKHIRSFGDVIEDEVEEVVEEEEPSLNFKMQSESENISNDGDGSDNVVKH